MSIILFAYVHDLFVATKDRSTNWSCYLMEKAFSERERVGFVVGSLVGRGKGEKNGAV